MVFYFRPDQGVGGGPGDGSVSLFQLFTALRSEDVARVAELYGGQRDLHFPKLSDQVRRSSSEDLLPC